MSYWRLIMNINYSCFSIIKVKRNWFIRMPMTNFKPLLYTLYEKRDTRNQYKHTMPHKVHQFLL